MTSCVRTSQRADRRRARNAFTLIEVLMAAFVMAIGVLGLTALFAGAARQQQQSSQTTRSVAASQSANAIISDRFGPIENVEGSSPLKLGTSIPKNGQGDITVIENDQWYAVPRSLDDGSMTLNPNESSTGWRDDTLYNRATPREDLPRLLFRTRVEKRNAGEVHTGIAGGEPRLTDPFGLLDDPGVGAPDFDKEIRELRVIADSITLRVVVREYPCAAGAITPDERALNAPIDTELRFRYKDIVGGDPKELSLVDDSGENEIRIFSDPKAKDSQLTTNGISRLTFAYIKDVATGIEDPGCGATPTQYWVQVDEAMPTDCDGSDTGWSYLWTAAMPGTGDFGDVPSTDTGKPGYKIIEGSNSTERYLYAELKQIDRCNTSAALFVRNVAGNGDYVLSTDGVNPPANGIAPRIAIRPAQFPTKFVYEIWLEDYKYRGHTLASVQETVTYNRSDDSSGSRVPQLGYSMLFRRTSDALVQYALMSYAITPTYPPAADKRNNPDDDFFPVETKSGVESNNAPVRLVTGLDVQFDTDLGQYYILLSGAQLQSYSWVANPGQVLMFNGNASRNPPTPGADAPVRVVNVRKKNANELWAYLDGPPRARLKALPDYGGGSTFDAWAIQTKCEVTQRTPTTKGLVYFWGLKPIEARIFTVSP